MAVVIDVRHTVFKKFGLHICVALWCGFCTVGVQAFSAQANEDAALRAAVVVNMLIFVQWPDAASASSDLVLCTEAEGELSPYLHTLAGRTVNGRTLRVRSFANGIDLSACHAVLLQSIPSPDVANQLDEGRPLMVMTDAQVSDTSLDVVSLAQSSGRIVFDVNLATARRNKLQLSSKLLRLARKVVNE